jgi:hypothetical protein
MLHGGGPAPIGSEYTHLVSKVSRSRSSSDSLLFPSALALNGQAAAPANRLASRSKLTKVERAPFWVYCSLLWVHVAAGPPRCDSPVGTGACNARSASRRCRRTEGSARAARPGNPLKIPCDFLKTSAGFSGLSLSSKILRIFCMHTTLARSARIRCRLGNHILVARRRSIACCGGNKARSQTGSCLLGQIDLRIWPAHLQSQI